MGLNSKLKVGTLVHIKDLEGKIIGLINYANPQDNGKCWTEYRIKTNKGSAGSRLTKSIMSIRFHGQQMACADRSVLNGMKWILECKL